MAEGTPHGGKWPGTHSRYREPFLRTFWGGRRSPDSVWIGRVRGPSPIELGPILFVLQGDFR